MVASNMNVVDFGTIQPVWVDYPGAVADSVAKAMREWKAFCERPLSVKERLVFQEVAGIGDAGYEFRRANREKKVDGKETFHFTLGEASRLQRYVSKDKTALDGHNFLSACYSLEEQCFPFVLSFAHHLAETFSSLPKDFVDRIILSRRFWTYRFLHYFPEGENEVIAMPHTDKGNFTLHIDADAPGLEYLDADGKTWLPMDSGLNSTSIIPSMQMQYVSDGEVKALCHRVVSSKQVRAKGRYAIVCFVDMHNTPVYNKALAGRSQLFTPGYNYTMPFEEFRKLFV